MLPLNKWGQDYRFSQPCVNSAPPHSSHQHSFQVQPNNNNINNVAQNFRQQSFLFFIVYKLENLTSTTYCYSQTSNNFSLSTVPASSFFILGASIEVIRAFAMGFRPSSFSQEVGVRSQI